MKKTIRKSFHKMFSLVLLLLCTPSLALADTGQFALLSVLSDLADMLGSKVAKAVFVVSIIGVGYGWLYLGKIPKGRAMGVIIGIGIIFSATYISQHMGV